jgi:predicted kinase
VCGLAASGKSTLAAALAERAGAVVISSDLVRKELLGIEPGERAPASAYDVAMNRRTYQELGRRAREHIATGDRVVVDATFRFAADREAFGEAGLAWIECRAPVAVRTRRAAGRMTSTDRISDADADVARVQASEWDPLDDAIVVETDREPAAVLIAVRDGLDGRLRGELRTRSVA